AAIVSQTVVLGVAAFVPIIAGFVGRVGDPGDRLDVLEPELHRRDEAERGAMGRLERAAGQVRGEQGLGGARRLQGGPGGGGMGGGGGGARAGRGRGGGAARRPPAGGGRVARKPAKRTPPHQATALHPSTHTSRVPCS